MSETESEAPAPAENESAIPGHLANIAAGNNPGAFESSPPRLGQAEIDAAAVAEAPVAAETTATTEEGAAAQASVADREHLVSPALAALREGSQG